MKQVFGNTENGAKNRELVVPMPMKSLAFWIGEKIKRARTRVCDGLSESERV